MIIRLISEILLRSCIAPFMFIIKLHVTSFDMFQYIQLYLLLARSIDCTLVKGLCLDGEYWLAGMTFEFLRFLLFAVYSSSRSPQDENGLAGVLCRLNDIVENIVSMCVSNKFTKSTMCPQEIAVIGNSNLFIHRKCNSFVTL